MLCHDNLFSYYRATNELMFRKQTIFHQNMSLTEIENLLPYEFAIYVNHISSTIEEYRKTQTNKT